MDKRYIDDCIEIGQDKYKYIHDTFDEMFGSCWDWIIRRHCRLFFHFSVYRDELEKMIKIFNNETKRILLLKTFCSDVTNEIISYL